MTKPWEETWRVVKLPSCDEWEVESDHVGMLEMSDPAHVALASAAPDMARVLLAVEWAGLTCVDVEWYAPCCPSCGGVDPAPWLKDVQARIEREGFTLGHKPDCELDAALRKAGVR